MSNLVIVLCITVVAFVGGVFVGEDTRRIVLSMLSLVGAMV